MQNGYDWEVVVEVTVNDWDEIRKVVYEFSTNDYDEEVLQRVYDKYAERYADNTVYIREKGKSLYRLVVEMNGKREYAPIEDDMPLSVVYEHIRKVRELHSCYKIPIGICLEHYIYEVWSRWF